MKRDDVPLREYINQRFDDQEKAVQAALVAADKLVSAALISQEKAVRLNADDVQKWRDNANEWRGAMSDRERDFLTRREFYAMIATAAVVFGILVAGQQ